MDSFKVFRDSEFSKATDRTRRPIIFAYWAVVLLTVPLWWYTTSIQRLSLPAQRVAVLADRELRLPIDVNIDTPDTGISQEVQRTLSQQCSAAIQLNVRDREGHSGVCTFLQDILYAFSWYIRLKYCLHCDKCPRETNVATADAFVPVRGGLALMYVRIAHPDQKVCTLRHVKLLNCPVCFRAFCCLPRQIRVESGMWSNMLPVTG
jgi:hypothetical protein